MFEEMNFPTNHVVLELRQHKNDSIQSKKIPILKLPHFLSPTRRGKKERQFQNWNFFANFSPPAPPFSLFYRKDR